MHSELLAVVIDGTKFAIRANLVVGVTEVGPLTLIPFSPPPFEGLVIAFSLILPQIDLARLLSGRPGDGKVLVVLSHPSGSVALRVDRVLSLINPEAGLAPPHDGDPFCINGHLDHRGTDYAHLDLDRLLADRALDMDQGPAIVQLGEAEGESPVAEAEEAVPTRLLLTIGISDRRYAVPVDDIVETIDIEAIRPVDEAPDWLTGMIDVRGTPLAALSLARLLRPDEAAVGTAIAGLVVRQGPGRIVLLVDRIDIINHVSIDQLFAMPQPIAGIASYYVEASESMVGVIDVSALLAPLTSAIEAWMPVVIETAEDGGVAAYALPQQFLTARIGTEICAFAIDRIDRIEDSVKLTPLPAEARGFDGLADTAEGVVPVIDLRRRIPDERRIPGAAAPCLLARLDGGLAGLVIDQVLRIEDISASDLEVVEDLPSLPITHVAHIGQTLASVIALERLLPRV